MNHSYFTGLPLPSFISSQKISHCFAWYFTEIEFRCLTRDSFDFFFHFSSAKILKSDVKLPNLIWHNLQGIYNIINYFISFSFLNSTNFWEKWCKIANWIIWSVNIMMKRMKFIFNIRMLIHFNCNKIYNSQSIFVIEAFSSIQFSICRSFSFNFFFACFSVDAFQTKNRK